MKAKLLLALLTVVALAGAADSRAQTPEIFHTAVAGQLLNIGVISEPTRPLIRVLPRNGVARFNSSGTRTGAIGPDVVEYTSTTGFVGKDTFQVEYWSPTPFPRSFRTNYIITVAASFVEAQDDYAATTSGQAVTVPVLANDSSSFGGLSISALTVVTGGSAFIQGGDVVVTPSPGFAGVASVQYVACDLLGVCDRATAHVTVSEAVPMSDTLAVQLPKNGQQIVFLDPQGFVLTTAPQHGTLASGYPLRYVANANYVGSDAIEWTLQAGSTTYTKRVEIEVLDIPAAPLYARADEAFISKNTVAYIDVLGNDLQGATLSGFGIATPPQHGTVAIVNRQIVYTPNLRFTGIDKFRYRVFPPGYSGPAEYATVTVLVSDLPPASFEFALETPKNTPLVFEYPVPLTNYSFGVVNPQPAHGQALFLPAADTTIAGYDIAGERLLVYNPAPGFTGQDLVRVNYCITTTGACVALNLRITVKNLTAPPGGWCVQDCVWPGDTDGNGRVEVADLLPIGRKMGMQGTTRSGLPGDWRGLAATDWQEFDQDRDLKYVDANGDGIISAGDTATVLANLDRYHSPYPAPTAPLKPMPFVLSFPYDTIYAGELYAIDIELGTAADYADDVYGFTLGFNFNTAFVLPGSQSLVYEEDAWIGYGTAELNIVDEPVFGTVRSAYTRTDGRAATGHGLVARFHYIGVEDVLGFRPARTMVAGSDPRASASVPQAEIVGEADFAIVDASVSIGGVSYAVPGSTLRVPVAVRPKGLAIRDQDLVVYPNPATSGAAVRVHLNGVESIAEVRVISDLGRVVTAYRPTGNDLQVETAQLSSGVYTVEVDHDGGTLRRRIVVQ